MITYFCILFAIAQLSTLASCAHTINNNGDTEETKLDFSVHFPQVASNSDLRFTSSRLSGELSTRKRVRYDPQTDATLVHGRDRLRVRTRQAPTRPSYLREVDTVLKSKSFSSDTRLRPSLGNGHVATVVKNDAIFMNGLYNGYNVTSHRARIPSPLISDLNVSCFLLLNNPCSSVQVAYVLDVGGGIFIQTITGNGFVIKLTSYAHRTIPQLLVQEMDIINTLKRPLQIMTNVNSGKSSEDIDFTSQYVANYRVESGRTRQPEYNITGLQNVTVISTNVPKTIVATPYVRETHVFLVSVDKDYVTAKQAYDEGVSKFMSQTLQEEHSQAWYDVWKRGRISFEGNDTLSQITFAAMYYILSALPLKETPDFVGLSPGDLAHGDFKKASIRLSLDYQGHVFWDQETWMYPPVQMLHADIGKAIIQSRLRVLDTAKLYAKSRGYQGAMFPWESALSGLNVCPWDPATLYEQHVTGDVALALRQYLTMTNDTSILTKGRGLEAITEIANFWASRVEKQPGSDQYGVFGVMPPDEYHEKVNNSAYTNVIAKISLLLPKFAYGLIGQLSDVRHEDIGNNMYIPFDSKIGYHPEFDGYINNITVKQADVVLLGYPLMEPMDQQIRRNDLEIYKKVTPGGPAMTWGMFSIGYLELNDTVAAADMFLRQLLNVVPPFNIWTENIKQEGAVNFITGMGGYLQSLIFGYGGFRMYPNYLEFSGTPPPGVTSFNITGIDYLGGSLDFTFYNNVMTVTQTEMAARELKIKLYKTGLTHALHVGQQMLYGNQKAAIMPV
ncbi:hypothetical protein FSP39_021562 [Pinctada imbricata]|uniref:Protein-glucosylgalactosylhydroxylysine glucosidase n=1 Tax=Pinctada imbricata TaxID=66713 RepID=A0AA89BTH8_PINIB|nr:hypothetical protein FSP39_021562 [Pinctada imbricata]